MSPEAPISTLRLALRAANGFALEMLQVYRGDRDFADAVIIATLVQCNAGSVTGEAALRRRYAGFDTPPPEELRRAISVNALAASLGLPFETVRRRTKQLIADGICVSTAAGVRFADGVIGGEAQRRSLERTYALVQALYDRLVRANCVQLMTLPALAAPDFPPEAPPVRIVWRAAADYFLRMMELLLPNFSNLATAFIVLEVARANTQGLSDAVRGEDGTEPEAFVPDSCRRPVRASDVADKLGLPHETVRRNLQALVKDGRCQRAHDGYIVPAAVLARPNVVAAWSANFRNLGRMFGELADTGVLALWDAGRGAESAA